MDTGNFAGTHTIGTAVRSHPRERKEIESARSADGVKSGCSFNCLIGHLFFNPRGFRPWQLAEEHGLALERQAEEHHRLEEEKKRESRKLPSQAEKRREWRKRRLRPYSTNCRRHRAHEGAQAAISNVRDQCLPPASHGRQL